ncbi:MAG TPA: FAD-dependent oxidoreductase [Lautropia sp.]|jgi:pyridine nucleotide-disulfide oxidoreductase family protein|nr:FAD-dependent oxidoreductase [Lautropia sp.]
MGQGGDLRRLLLVGAGHAHVQVLSDWSRKPVAGTELVLVSPGVAAPYSGMVPGWLTGSYRFDEICIDIAGLAAAAGARLVVDEVDAVDAGRRQVRLASGRALDYDLLSLNVGSTLHPPAAHGAFVLPLRPLGRLHAAWESLLVGLQQVEDDRPLTVTAVGGGAAGFEALLAVLSRLRSVRPGRRLHGRLVSQAPTLLPGLAPGAVRAAGRALARAGVTTQLGTPWCEAIAGESDLLLWATGAEAHDWQSDPSRRGGLATGDRGFIRIDSQLRSVSHPDVFAAGDCTEWHVPLPKSGVYAVRMGPVLAHNLRAALQGGTPATYRPQHRFLALLATGDGRAIGSRGHWSAEGRWLWHWKDHIDRRFVRRFSNAGVGTPAGTSAR